MLEYNPYALDVQHDPYPIWKRLRDEEPVYFNPKMKFWALSRYDDVHAAFLDASTFISGEGATIEGVDKGSGGLIQLDAPEHTIYRKLMAHVFTPRRIAALEPYIRRVAGEYLDAVGDRESFDLVQDFSLHLPLDVISELLGIPEELRARIHELSSRSVIRDAAGDPAAIATAREASMQTRALLTELVVDRRKHPREGDLVSTLVTAEITDDEGRVHAIPEERVVAQFRLLSSAGHETIMKAIGNGAVALARYPDQRTQLVCDPSLIPNAVEEMLRWDNPAPIEARWSTRDVSLHGATIPKDSRVVLLMGAANHDDRKYEDPERFDVHRVLQRPLTFGFGAHRCIGAALARLEMRVAFEELLARFPSYEIDEENVSRGSVTFFRGLNNLPIFTRR